MKAVLKIPLPQLIQSAMEMKISAVPNLMGLFYIQQIIMREKQLIQ